MKGTQLKYCVCGGCKPPWRIAAGRRLELASRAPAPEFNVPTYNPEFQCAAMTTPLPRVFMRRHHGETSAKLVVEAKFIARVDHLRCLSATNYGTPLPRNHRTTPPSRRRAPVTYYSHYSLAAHQALLRCYDATRVRQKSLLKELGPA
eukprot:1055669-Pleurochrysis_carterae.AAC.1